MDSLGTGFSRTTTTHGAPRMVCRAAGAPAGEAEPTRPGQRCQSLAPGRRASDGKRSVQGPPGGDDETVAGVHRVRGARPGLHADEVAARQGPDRHDLLLGAEGEKERCDVRPGEADGGRP